MPTQGRRCLWGVTRCLRRPLAGYCPALPRSIPTPLPDNRLREGGHSVSVTSNSQLANGNVSINSSSSGSFGGWHSSLLREITPRRTLCRLGVSLRAASPAETNPVTATGPPRTAVRAATPTSIRPATGSKPDLNRGTAEAAEVTAAAATAHAQSSPCHPLVFGGLSAAQGGELNLTSYSPLDRTLLCIGGETTHGQWKQELQQTQKEQQHQAGQQHVQHRLCFEPTLKTAVRRPFIGGNDHSNNSDSTCCHSSCCIETTGFCHPIEATAVLATAAATLPASAAETDHPCIEGQHSEALQKGHGPSGAIAAAVTAPALISGPVPAAEGHRHSISGRGVPRADHRKAAARAFPVADCGETGSSTLSSPVASASAIPTSAATPKANIASRRGASTAVPTADNSGPNKTPTAAAVLHEDVVAVVPACSSCSLSSDSVWKKWLLLLSETDPQRLQELLLKYPPICKKHNKNTGAPGHGRFVVSFRQLLRLLEAAALHPHATEASVSVLRQRVRLGVEQQGGTGTVAAAAGATGVAESRKAMASVNPAAAAQIARRLAYVEGGLALLALEKGAQLMQSLLIRGVMLLAQASALLARELRLLHGDSFDFSSVIAQAAAAIAGLNVDSKASRPVVPRTTPIYTGQEQLPRRMQQQPLVLQKLLKVGGGKHRVRCVVCGGSLVVSAEELLRGRLACSDCATSSSALKATSTSNPAAGSTQAQFPGASYSGELSASSPSSLINHVKQHEQPEYGNLLRVLKQLETATSWSASRFALASPAFIASVCSSSRLPNIKVRVHPFPEALPHAFGSCGCSAAAVDAAETTPGPRAKPANPQLQHMEVAGLTLSPGSRFWAMPVSFIAAVHTRQVESLARLAETSSLQLLPAENVALASTSGAMRASAAAAHLEPIFVAAGTHAALRSLKNKLDQEGVETVRLSDEGAVLDALQAETPPHRALVLLDTIYQVNGNVTAVAAHTVAAVAALETAGHRLAKLKLKPRRVLVDESSQLTEFAALGALVNGADVVVLIGDERQLPPASALPPSASPRSLFSALKGGACRSVLLNVQFRMPPLLAAFISSHFYEGRLLTHSSRAGLLSPYESVLPSKQRQQHPQQFQRRPLQASDDADLAPLLYSRQHLIAASPASGAATQGTSGTRSTVGKTQCEDFVGGSRTVAVEYLDTAQDSCSFPWPDGSEGDKDLAKKLMEQLGAHYRSSEQACLSSRWAQELHSYTIPNVLPILFLDTSPWASGPSRRLAKITLPSVAPDSAAATYGLADAAGPSRSTDGCKTHVKSLPAEQRVKSSLQNPLSVTATTVIGEAFMVYRCVEVLLNSGASKQDIAVLTPYQAQAQLLSRVLHPAVGSGATEAVAVGGYQGFPEMSEFSGKPSVALFTQHRRKRITPEGAASGQAAFHSFSLISVYCTAQALDVLDERCRPHPQVFTVDGFQGHEREYIILSTVKGCRKSVREFFLFDPRRINVALSRASRGLIIVGNANALADASPTWSSFLLFLRTLGAALPLDHPSLRKTLTEGLLLPRPKPSQAVKQDPLSGLNRSKRMQPEKGEHGDLVVSRGSVETSE
ncbi:hypothetical protein, conserved [Eimeria brunetti]|uniref:DNA2/NAM7 helicase-like C-terminal domain-containing protein n=1 Tax=Eimeria brunetti TaxID=51314 RepID=U6LDB6_9EIME|nr:hypothetical protein, conserved [Eimeria brunetti]